MVTTDRLKVHRGSLLSSKPFQKCFSFPCYESYMVMGQSSSLFSSSAFYPRYRLQKLGPATCPFALRPSTPSLVFLWIFDWRSKLQCYITNVARWPSLDVTIPLMVQKCDRLKQSHFNVFITMCAIPDISLLPF